MEVKPESIKKRTVIDLCGGKATLLFIPPPFGNTADKDLWISDTELGKDWTNRWFTCQTLVPDGCVARMYWEDSMETLFSLRAIAILAEAWDYDALSGEIEALIFQQEMELEKRERDRVEAIRLAKIAAAEEIKKRAEIINRENIALMLGRFDPNAMLLLRHYVDNLLVWNIGLTLSHTGSLIDLRKGMMSRGMPDLGVHISTFRDMMTVLAREKALNEGIQVDSYIFMNYGKPTVFKTMWKGW